MTQIVAPDIDFGSIGGSLQPLVDAVNSLLFNPTLVTAATPALTWPKNYIITRGSISAMTLAAPVDVTDDGKIITLISNTAFAHTLTATGLLKTGSASVNVATFAAFGGAGLRLRAYNAKWLVEFSTGITFS